MIKLLKKILFELQVMNELALINTIYDTYPEVRDDCMQTLKRITNCHEIDLDLLK